MLKLQYFGHLMRRANSLEKTLMLGKIEGRRSRGWQRMGWLDGITDSTDMSLGRLQETVEGRGAWRAAVAKSRTWLSNWTAEETNLEDRLWENRAEGPAVAPRSGGKALSRSKVTLESWGHVCSVVRQGGCFWWTERHRLGDEQKPGGFRGSSEKIRINKDHGPGRRHSWQSGVGVRLLKPKGVVHKWRALSSGSHGAGTPALCPRLILFYETQIPGAMFLYGICKLNIYFVWGQSIYYSSLIWG